MKIRTRKFVVDRMLLWYAEEISKQFLNIPMSITTLVRMDSYLKQLQHQQRAREPQNEIWSFPVKLRETPEKGYGAIEVYLDEEFSKSLLFIDWPT